MVQYNDEINLKDILIKLSQYKTYLLSKKLTIIGFSFLFSIIGILISISKETEYIAELTFVVEGEKRGGSLAEISGITSQFGFDIGGSESATFSQSNILELLKSRGVIVSALLQNSKLNGKKDLLIEHYLELNKIKESWLQNEDFKGVSFHANKSVVHDSISGAIWKSIIDEKLIVEMESDEANIINLSYSSIDDEFAKSFVETLINEMSKMYISHQTRI